MHNKKLNNTIKDKGFKKQYIALELGITPYCLAKKLNGENEFKVSEMVKLSNLLDLSEKEKNDIFFA